MRNWLAGCAAVATLSAVAFYMNARPTEAGGKKGQMLAHMVYFSLKDPTPANKEKLVAACHKYLSKHPGEVFYAAGTLCEELKRDVNDINFDVALHIVFTDKKAQDVYQDAPRHTQFIEENKSLWSKVRVFDSVVGR